jgi:peptidoglycan DL-endopeptidase CwlO
VRRLRLAVATLVTLALCGATVPAWSDPVGADRRPAYPSQGQVDDARARVAQKAHDVGVIKGRLLLADQALEQAATRAEQASEAYNGAMWRLQQARQKYRTARREAARAERTVAAQRDRIGALVAQSYQDGGQISALNAMMGADGPEGVLDQYAAIQGASTSLDADYKRFSAADALAGVFASQARQAKARQQDLAEQARHAKDRAVGAAEAAQAQASRIAVEKDQLIRSLAQAQDISVTLARQRQSALEEIARQRAAERARRAAIAAARAQAAAEARARAAAQREARAKAQEEARQARARKAAAERSAAANARAAAPAPRRTRHHVIAHRAHRVHRTVTPTFTPPPPPPPVAPPRSRGGARQAIRYAEAQLGEPYVWGAAGPGSWDCSGLMMRAWESAGTYLPHYSVAQYEAGVPISVTDLRPGDLVFWSTNGQPSGIHHVAMYIGNGQIIHAPRTGRPVEIDDMYYWIPPDFFVRV